MPAEYQHHLALYDGISAEHSSIDDIMQKAQQLEKTLILLKIGRNTDKLSIPASNPSTGGRNQRSIGSQCYNPFDLSLLIRPLLPIL